MLAWAASTAATRDVTGTGALGPVVALGLNEFEAGARAAGIERVQ